MFGEERRNSEEAEKMRTVGKKDRRKIDGTVAGGWQFSNIRKRIKPNKQKQCEKMINKRKAEHRPEKEGKNKRAAK